METIKNTVNQISENIQGAGADASKEANKNVAKDSNASVGTRATAAKDAVSDKVDAKKHDTNAEVYKQKNDL